MSENAASAAPPSPNITPQLSRRKSSGDRIRDILEGARERAESLDVDPASPRLQPLLGDSHRRASGPSVSASPPAIDPTGRGVVTAQPERQRTLNYQSTAEISPAARRRSARGGKSSTAPQGPPPPGADGTGEEDELQGGPRGQQDEPRWKRALHYFKSIELENKGSVARDHLALERTFLAWLRTSLAFASIGIAITQLFRLNTSLAEDTKQAERLRHLGKPLGTAFLAVSILILLLGYNRYLRGQYWVIRGKYPASRGTIMLVSLIAFTVTLASLIVILVVQNNPMNIPTFAQTQLSLLASELAAEIAESSALVSLHSPTALQRAGVALTNLTVAAQRTGLGGKTVLELGPDPATHSHSGGGADLPEHGIRTGDIVLVAEQPSAQARKREVKELERGGVKGVVTRVGRGTVAVAVEERDGSGDGEGGMVGEKRVWIVKVADDVTFRRMNATMERLANMGEAEYSPFIRVLFGLSSPSPVPADLAHDPEVGEIEWVDPTLNDSQKEAIRFALASREIALIHGPPGTGKTHTLIELILQLLKRNLRIVVCGPSNISVDNIVERLAPHKVPLIRLGHPARLLPSVLNHSLDVLTRTSEAGAIVQDVRAEMDAKQASIRKTRSGKERKAIYADLKELRKEYRERERRCVSNLVAGSKVVLATLHGSGGFQLRDEQFDVVIIDEASQALEAQCWVPLLAAKKAICAGDHLQLPPTIKSLNSKSKSSSSKKGKDATANEQSIKGATLETTLFDRLLKLHGPSIKRMLTTQYRMHEKIMRFPSDELYEGKLIAADAVKARLLKDLPYDVEATDDTTEPLIFIDTQGGDFPEKNEDEQDAGGGGKKLTKSSIYGDSKSNEMEAALVRQHVRSLVEAGVKPEDIAVVTPYNAQLAILAPLKETYPGIELGSVDGFQGREKEAVIVSLVRSNPDGEVGFLGEKRRLNVAMTRPKRSLTVIGDSETVKKGSKFLKNWMEYLEENADLRYPDLASLVQGA
ncbi:P-loop containing nucleoside triphosphate hydrolase protein [Achaetomium macrosporum]|uniref:DNA helicase n=1 Tax=Achaetomium macrosporum TaxID=79813 RepID=A0AAN7C8Q0_9PEZI|nr:P-loop containing nucleoside triphosphate hydrolase protein [Achaetomium macrosporum]